MVADTGVARLSELFRLNYGQAQVMIQKRTKDLTTQTNSTDTASGTKEKIGGADSGQKSDDEDPVVVD